MNDRPGGARVVVVTPEELAELVRAAVREAIGEPKSERVPLDSVADEGAPSRGWVEARARKGKITIHGPRGGRYVEGADLAALLATETIRRRRPAVVSPPNDGARGVLLELAERRVRGSGAR